MKFIHCADLHLDSRMESNLSLDQEKQRREELLATFSRMVDYAQENDVRAILIAGDLFDKQHIRKEVRERVQLKIEENPGIDFLYLRGNHDFVDFLDEMEQIPANLKLFKEEEWTAYEYEEGVTVTGREISNRNYRLLTESLVLDEEKCNIVILHGKEAGSGGGDHTRVVDISSYKEKYIDYLALGHLHSYKKGKIDERGTYCYSGCLEGRNFDECGEKGFVLLQISNQKVKSSFIPFAKRLLHDVPVELSVKDDMFSIMEKVSEALSSYPEKDLIRLRLSGKRKMNFDIDKERIQTVYGESFFHFIVEDETRAVIDYESYANDRSLKGAFVRLMQAENLPVEEREHIIEIGMKAIMGEEL